MSLAQTTKKAMRIYDLLDKSYAIKINTIRLSTHNSPQHELAKALVAIELMYQGNTIITEAIFKDGKGRADVICIETMTCYEITHTEKPDAHKDEIYGMPIIYLDAKRIIETQIPKIMKGKL